jgi:hypothetical protein
MTENLPAIKVSLALPGAVNDHLDPGGRSEPGVKFEVARGGNVVAERTVEQEHIGLPGEFDPGRYRAEEPALGLSSELARWLGRAIESLRLQDREALWLQLAAPIGYLAALPWERMLGVHGDPHLRAMAQRPLLRIPDFTLVPERGGGPFRAVICVSEPDGQPASSQAALLSSLLYRSSFIPSQPGPIEVHVFPDLPTYRRLRQLEISFAGHVLHHPEESTGVRPGADPWLAWLRQEMRGTPVDTVLFHVHGQVTGGQPAIALSESPLRHDDQLWARLITPSQLAECLTQLGAWSVGFTAPPGNFSPLGLRLFADKLARLRPGPVFYHSGELSGLAQLYGQLFQGRVARLRDSEFIYIHPKLAGITRDPAYAESLVQETLGPESPAQARPSWATLTRRYLEQSVAQAFPGTSDPGSAEQAAVGTGMRNALAYIDEVMRRHGGGPA